MALARIPAHDPQHPSDVAAFIAGLSGTAIRPEDAAYDEARQVHNASVDKRPVLIVQAANAGDVARTVVFARETGLELAVRGGSHSLAGHGTSEGGIVLDLGAMKGLHIDPERRLAWAQPGLRAEEYTVAAAAHGLATPFGDTGSVGIAGLTLGGGIGWLVRRHGLAIDALVSVEIVTADGRLLTASATEHPDLFWAVRGGGGNFGVVTRFQYRLYPVPQIFGGALFMPATREVLQALQPIAASAPEELTTISFLMAAPPAPFIPAEVHFQPTLAIMFVYDGDPEAGAAAIAPFRQVATPLAELVMPMPYPGIYEMLRDAEQRGPASHRSLFLDTLDDAAIDEILARHADPELAVRDDPDPHPRRGHGPRPGRRHGLRPSRRQRDGHDHHAVRGSGRAARPRRLDAGLLRGPAAPLDRGLQQLPRGRGRRPDPRGLSHRDVPPAGRGQAPLRPDQPVPPQPEHPAGDGGLTSAPRRRRDTDAGPPRSSVSR